MLKEMEITLEQAFAGDSKKISHKRYRPCASCDGMGGEEAKKCGKCKGRGVVIKMVQMGPGMYTQSQATCRECRGEGEIIKNKCKDCNGEKISLVPKSIDIPIQPGTYDEYLYILTGEGHETPDVMAGDLAVKFSVKKHRLFERKGADLFMNKKITLLEALTGFTFNVKTLDKKVLKVATMPGEVITHT